MQKIEPEVIFTRHLAEKEFSDEKNSGRAFVRSTQVGKDRNKRELVLELAGPNICAFDRKFTAVIKSMSTTDARELSDGALEIARKVENWRPVPLLRPYTEFAVDLIHGVRIGASATNDMNTSFFIQALDDGHGVRCEIGKMEDLQELMNICASAEHY